MFLAAWP